MNKKTTKDKYNNNFEKLTKKYNKKTKTSEYE